MTTAAVTATKLNFRNASAGKIIESLPYGTEVSVLGQGGDWLRVSTSVKGVIRVGWVSGRFVHTSAAVPPATAGPVPLGARFRGTTGIGTGTKCQTRTISGKPVLVCHGN